jgi:DNA-binding beta-propeller fold protein YncE
MKFGSTGSGPGQLSQPYGVAISGNRLYVDESGNSRISVFDLNGNFIGMWGSKGPSGKYQFNAPKGIAIDSAGLIYVVDTQNQRIEVFQP